MFSFDIPSVQFLFISWPRSFTCSSVAQTLAGAAYLPTSAFAVQGRPLWSSFSSWGFCYLSDSGLLLTLPFGLRLLSLRWVPLYTLSTFTLPTTFYHLPIHLSFRAPCHLGQPPIGLFSQVPVPVAWFLLYWLGPSKSINNTFQPPLTSVLLCLWFDYHPGNCGLPAI